MEGLRGREFADRGRPAPPAAIDLALLKGLGVRESFANPRFWVLGTCIAVPRRFTGM